MSEGAGGAVVDGDVSSLDAASGGGGAPIATSEPLTYDPVLLGAFCVLFCSAFAFYATAAQRPDKARVFHFLSCTVTGVAAIAYLVMAFGGGAQVLTLEDGSTRTFFYVRYADWLVTTPLLLLDLGLLAGAPLPSVLAVMGLDVMMVLSGLAGPVFFAGEPVAKWALFGLGMAWLFPVLHAVGSRWPSMATAQVFNTYRAAAYPTLALWAAYPAVWAACEGLNVLSEEWEVLAYAVLDVLAKAGVSAVLLANHRAVDHAARML